MKVSFLILLSLLAGLLPACTQEKATNNPVNCELLLYDNLYNHFYLNDRSIGFTGNCQSFYPNGNKKEERSIKNGKNSGKYKFYFPSGQLNEEGSFEDNLQNGTRKLYNEKGDLVATEEYKFGTIVSKH